MRRFLFGLLAIASVGMAGCENRRDRGVGEELQRGGQETGEEIREEGQQFKEGVEDRTNN